MSIDMGLSIVQWTQWEIMFRCYAENIVTFSIMETIFSMLHKKNTILIKIEKWQIVLKEGLFRAAIQRVDHQQFLTMIVNSYHTTKLKTTFFF